MNEKPTTESIVREISRRTRKKYSSEEKIRIVLEGLRSEASSHYRGPHKKEKARPETLAKRRGRDPEGGYDDRQQLGTE